MSNRLHSVPEAAERLGVGRDKVYAAINAGELLSVKVGRRRLISDRAINDFIERLEERSGSEASAA